ncbi:MAG: hypothetical protein JWO25_3806 [Alphaproteobacteria bacterium]|nr:hypothetical protein [Alphaproteobacteria bacterium]
MNNASKALIMAAACLTIAGCKVSKTQDAKLPDVEVNATGGQLPEFNVQGPEVDVGSKNETIKVPTVSVKAPGDKKDDDKSK